MTAVTGTAAGRVIEAFMISAHYAGAVCGALRVRLDDGTEFAARPLLLREEAPELPLCVLFDEPADGLGIVETARIRSIEVSDSAVFVRRWNRPPAAPVFWCS